MAKTLRGVVEMDTWTGLPIMIRKDYRRLCVYPLDLLDRKVSVFLVVDLDAPLSRVSMFPTDDVVHVRVNTRRTLLVLATNVDHAQQCFEGHELRQVRGYSDRFSKQSRTISFCCCDVVDLVPHRSIAGCVYICSN